MRSLVSISDLAEHEVADIVRNTLEFAKRRASLKDAEPGCVGLLFELTSTRTRTAFSLATQSLGHQLCQYGPSELQFHTGESMRDTGLALAQYLDVLVVRSAWTNDTLRELSGDNALAVVNALSADEHPTQALSDLATLTKHFGSLDGLHVLYMGEANSTVTALARAVSMTPGLRLTIVAPPGYGLSNTQASSLLASHKTRIHELASPSQVPRDVDAVYVTQWNTTGTTKKDPRWREAFAPFVVSSAFFESVVRRTDAILMHDMPAHPGEEISSELMRKYLQNVLSQARMKLASAAAILQWCFET